MKKVFFILIVLFSNTFIFGTGTTEIKPTHDVHFLRVIFSPEVTQIKKISIHKINNKSEKTLHIEKEFNKNGYKIREVKYPNIYTKNIIITNWEYDKSNRVIKKALIIDDKETIYEYIYNDKYMVAESKSINGLIKETFEYDYDLQGNLVNDKYIYYDDGSLSSITERKFIYEDKLLIQIEEYRWRKPSNLTFLGSLNKLKYNEDSTLDEVEIISVNEDSEKIVGTINYTYDTQGNLILKTKTVNSGTIVYEEKLQYIGDMLFEKEIRQFLFYPGIMGVWTQYDPEDGYFTKTKTIYEDNKLTEVRYGNVDSFSWIKITNTNDNEKIFQSYYPNINNNLNYITIADEQVYLKLLIETQYLLDEYKNEIGTKVYSTDYDIWDSLAERKSIQEINYDIEYY